MDQKEYTVEDFGEESGSDGINLKGQVVDQDGEPIANAELQVKGEQEDEEYSTTTDSEGWFLIEDVPAGTYSVVVKHEEREAEGDLKLDEAEENTDEGEDLALEWDETEDDDDYSGDGHTDYGDDDDTSATGQNDDTSVTAQNDDT